MQGKLNSQEERAGLHRPGDFPSKSDDQFGASYLTTTNVTHIIFWNGPFTQITIYVDYMACILAVVAIGSFHLRGSGRKTQKSN